MNQTELTLAFSDKRLQATLENEVLFLFGDPI
jgi:hypothetical protein